MKILLTHRPGGAYAFISDGWQNALRAAGHICDRWDGNHDTWLSFKPDLYIGCSGHRQPIPDVGTKLRGECKIAIHVNPYFGDPMDGIAENIDAINWVVRQKPTVVFGYGHETDRCYWDHWTTKHGIVWVPMPTAGDSVIFTDLKLNRNVQIAYVGGYWAYKAKNIDKYLLPLLRQSDLHIEAYGWGDWPAGVVRGRIEDDDLPKLLNRALVGPCVTEPHTTKWGIDLPERLWKVALCGALVVHDPVKGLERFLPSAIVADQGSYVDVCKHYASAAGAAERVKIAECQHQEVLRKHTYFTRMSKLFMTIHETVGTGDFGTEALKLSMK